MESKQEGIKLNQQAEKYYKRLLLVSDRYLMLMKKSKKQTIAIYVLLAVLIAENYLLWDYLVGLVEKVIKALP